MYEPGGGGNKQVRPEGSCLMRRSCGGTQKHKEEFKGVLRRVSSNRAAVGKAQGQLKQSSSEESTGLFLKMK